MIRFKVTYVDGSTATMDVHDITPIMDVAAFFDAESAEIISYIPSA